MAKLFFSRPQTHPKIFVSQVDKDFAATINKSDWVGLFEEGWQYLFSYLTFVWVTKVAKDDDEKLIMTVVFKKDHLPQRDRVCEPRQIA